MSPSVLRSDIRTPGAPSTWTSAAVQTRWSKPSAPPCSAFAPSLTGTRSDTVPSTAKRPPAMRFGDPADDGAGVALGGLVGGDVGQGDDDVAEPAGGVGDADLLQGRAAGQDGGARAGGQAQLPALDGFPASRAAEGGAVQRRGHGAILPHAPAAHRQLSRQSIPSPALGAQQLVDAAEGPGAEEPARGRQRARVHPGDDRHPVQQGRHRLRVACPTAGPRADRRAPASAPHGRVGHGLPAQPAVRARTPRAHRQDPVQQQDPGPRPGGEVAVRRGPARRCRRASSLWMLTRLRGSGPHVRLDGEAQPDRVARGRVGVLPDQQHPDAVEGLPERPQHVPGGGQPRRGLGGQPLRELDQASGGPRASARAQPGSRSSRPEAGRILAPWTGRTGRVGALRRESRGGTLPRPGRARRGEGDGCRCPS